MQTAPQAATSAAGAHRGTTHRPAVRLVDDYSAPYLKFNGREPRTLEELAIARQEAQHRARLREIKAMAAKLALLDAHLPALVEHGVRIQHYTPYTLDDGKDLSFHAPATDRTCAQLHQALLAIGFQEIERRDWFGRTDRVTLKSGRALLVQLEVPKLEGGAA